MGGGGAVFLPWFWLIKFFGMRIPWKILFDFFFENMKTIIYQQNVLIFYIFLYIKCIRKKSNKVPSHKNKVSSYNNKVPSYNETSHHKAVMAFHNDGILLVWLWNYWFKPNYLMLRREVFTSLDIIRSDANNCEICT